MDRALKNREKAKKNIFISIICLLVLLIHLFVFPKFSNSEFGIFVSFVCFLGFIGFFIAASIGFIGQKVIKTKDEIDTIWEERNKRKCINCGYIGGMKYFLETTKGQLILLVCLLFFLVPGIIYWLVVRGKKVCPNCQSWNNALI